MIVKEVIQRVQSLYSKGVQSSDSRLSRRHIFNVLSSLRSKLVSQKAKKNQHLSQWNYQTIDCMELIVAKPYECPCLPPIGCTILRTKFELPKPLVDMNGDLIQSVTSVDGVIRYDETTWNEKRVKAGNKYTKTRPDYYIRNNHLFITHKDGPKVIATTALFENPEDVWNYPSYCDNDCVSDCLDCISPLDQEFPIDNDQIDTLIGMAANELIDRFNRSLEDKTNNSSDSVLERSK